MTDVQLENGYTRIANELLDAIQSFQFTQNQFKLLLALWRNTYGWNRKECEFSLNQIISQTGLQRKRVIETLKSLEENGVIIEVKPPSGTRPKIVRFNKNYVEWTVKKYTGMNARSGQYDTPREQTDDPSSGHGDTPKDDLVVPETTPLSSGQNDTPVVVETTPLPVVTATPLSSGHGDTPLKKEKDNIKTRLNKAAAYSDPNFSSVKESEYAHTVINHFLKLRNRGSAISPDDHKVVEEFMENSIPLETVLAGIGEAFDSYKPKREGDRISTLKYCKGRIMDKHFGISKNGKHSLFDADPNTRHEMDEDIKKWAGQEVDMDSLPF